MSTSLKTLIMGIEKVTKALRYKAHRIDSIKLASLLSLFRTEKNTGIASHSY